MCSLELIVSVLSDVINDYRQFNGIEKKTDLSEKLFWINLRLWKRIPKRGWKWKIKPACQISTKQRRGEAFEQAMFAFNERYKRGSSEMPLNVEAKCNLLHALYAYKVAAEIQNLWSSVCALRLVHP